MQKIRKILRAVSEKTVLPTNQPTTDESAWFWANLETFLRISPNQEFFSKIQLCHFSTFIVPQLKAKNQKNLYSHFWENCIINQAIITNNTDLIGPRWCWSKKQVGPYWCWSKKHVEPKVPKHLKINCSWAVVIKCLTFNDTKWKLRVWTFFFFLYHLMSISLQCIYFKNKEYVACCTQPYDLC